MRSLLASSQSRRKISALLNGASGKPPGAPAGYTFRWLANDTMVTETGPDTYNYAVNNRWSPETGLPALANLCPYSTTVGGIQWTKDYCSGTVASATDPFGVANNATTLTRASAASVTPAVYFATGAAAVRGFTYTYSVYLKYGTQRYVCVDMSDSVTGGVYVYVDLTTGTITQAVAISGAAWTNASAEIESIGNGWYRVSVTGKHDNSALKIIPYVWMSGGATGGEVPTAWADASSPYLYIFGPQVQLTPKTAYVPVASSAVYLPRYITGKAGKAVFVEETSSQLLLYSDRFNISPWSTAQNGSTLPSVGTPTASDPFGGSTATEVTFGDTSAAAAYSLLYQAFTAATATYNSSIWIKAKAAGDIGKKIFLYQYDTAVRNMVTITLTAAWQRVATPPTTAMAAGAGRQWTIGTLGSAGGGIDQVGTIGCVLFGPQLEQQLYPTSYIPNPYNSGVMLRTYEYIAFNPTGALSASQGTVSLWVYIDNIKNKSGSSYISFFNHSNGGANFNRVSIGKDTAADRWQAITGDNAGLYSAHQATAALATGWHMFTITWNASELALWIDGVKQASPVASPKIPVTISTSALIGSASAGSQECNTAIDGVYIYPTVLSQADITKLYQTAAK